MEADQIKEFYDRFATAQARAGVNERHRLILSIALAHGAASAEKILEIGCGIGTFTGLLAKKAVKARILAIDISSVNIDNARKDLGHHHNVEFKALDAVNDPIDADFDLIVLPDVLEHIPPEQRPTLFSKLARHLKQEGRIVIHSPDPDHLEHLIQTGPENLQVIDIPLHLRTIIPEIETAGLRLIHFQRHSIWMRVPDYMALVLSHVPQDSQRVLLPSSDISLGKRILDRFASLKRIVRH